MNINIPKKFKKHVTVLCGEGDQIILKIKAIRKWFHVKTGPGEILAEIKTSNPSLFIQAIGYGRSEWDASENSSMVAVFNIAQ